MGFHGAGWWRYVRAVDEKPKLTWQLLQRVLTYAAPYRLAIVGMLGMILFTTGLNLLTPLILRDLIDRTIPAGDLVRLGWLVLVLLLIPGINGGIAVFQRRLNAVVGEGVIFDLRMALFSRLQRMSLRFFTNTRVGELMSRLNNDVVGAQNAVSNTVVNIITNAIQTAALLVVMLALEWHLTLLALLILPFFIWGARRIGDRLRDIARRQMDLNAQMNAHMNETLNVSGALLVKLFGRELIEVDRFRQRASQVREMGVRRAVVGASFFVFLGLLGSLGIALVYGVGGYLVIVGFFTIGTIVAFGSYLGSLYGALQSLANAPVEFSTSVVSFERVFEVIDLPQDIVEKADPLVLENVRGDLVFEDVTFRYGLDDANLLSDVKRHGQMDTVAAVLSGGGQSSSRGGASHKIQERALSGEQTQAREVALDAISFRADAGQLVALVGPSGAGKTTLTYLIPRLYDPTSGSIYLDGHKLSDVSLQSLMAQIGMVTQETYLFHDTIRTNLLYARLDATQDEIEAACRSANIHAFIVDLPDGYDTIVGERGYRLSGGEKQRLALARVILKNPRVLVLDEATSHLDSESETLIQDALKRVMAGDDFSAPRTSIVIAHRLSTILAADQILVMDRGCIVERGRHDDLLAFGGLYAHLYETQFKRERPH